MKKLALLISFMIIFALTSFAQIDVSVSGSADMTIGICLNASATGITNSNSSKISFTLVEGNSEKGGDADVHGYISLSGWKAAADSDGGWSVCAPGVDAKINFPGGWVGIMGAATKVNYINPLEDDDGDDDATDEGVSTELGKSGGMTIGLNIAPATIELGVFSENDWKQDSEASTTWDWTDADENEETEPVWAATTEGGDPDVNTDNAYGVSLKATVAAGPATIEVAAVMGLTYADAPIGLGVKADIAAGPASICVKSDIQVDDSTVFEAGVDVSMALVEGLSASLNATYGDSMGDDLDMKVGITEDGAGGVVPGLGAGLAVTLNNLMATLGWKVEVNVDYALATMKPYAKYTVDQDTAMTLKVGAELYVIENVTFDVNYESTDLGGDDNGVILIVTKIAY